MVRQYRYLAALVLGAAAGLAACGRAYAPAVPVSGAIAASVPHVAGTYTGTWAQHGGGKKPESGTVTITVHQKDSSVSGTIAAKYKSKTYDEMFTGTVTATKSGASIALTVKNNYGDGKGNATVISGKLKGQVVFPPRSSEPKTVVTFDTTKS